MSGYVLNILRNVMYCVVSKTVRNDKKQEVCDEFQI